MRILFSSPSMEMQRPNFFTRQLAAPSVSILAKAVAGGMRFVRKCSGMKYLLPADASSFICAR